MRPVAGRPVGAAVLAVLVATAWPATAAHAQGPSAAGLDAPCVGQKVSEVKLEVYGHPDYQQSLLSLVEVQPERPLTREDWRDASRLLTRLGGFEDVTISCSAIEGGWRVVFTATPPHPVTDLEFNGALDLAGTLRKSVLDRFGGMPATIAPEVVRGAVVDALADEGYRDAHVTVAARKFAMPDHATLVFTIGLGPRSTLGHVNIVTPNETIVPRDWVQRETGAVEGRPLRRGAINRGLNRIVNTLKSRGYYTASTLGVEVGATTDQTSDVTLTIDPGPAVVLQWTPGGDQPPGGIDDYVPVRQQNSIDADLLDDAKTRITTHLRNEGYLDADITYNKEALPGNRLAITYLVKRGPRYRVDHLQFPTGLAVASKDMAALVDIQNGDVLDPLKLNAGLVGIQSAFRQRGYYLANVKAGELVPAPNRPSTPKDVWRIVPIEIVTGPKGETVNLTFDRATDQVPEADLRQVVQSIRGSPFQPGMRAGVESAIKTLYDDLGYRSAVVRVEDGLTPDGRTINRTVHITEGPRLVVLDVTVIGAHDIKEKEIRDEIVLHPGDAFGATTQRLSQSRLYNWGVFRSVSIEPLDPPKPTDTGVHLVVRVVEAPDTTISYGADVEAGYKKRTVSINPQTVADRLEFAPRLFFEIGRRNLGGRNRVLDWFTRVSLRPRDAPGTLQDGHGYRPSEYRTALTYAEKRAFGTNIDWVFGVSSEQAIRTTFDFRRQAANMDFTRRVSSRVTANLRYTIDFTRVYNQRFCADPTDYPNHCTLDEQKQITLTDRVFPQVRLSFLTFDVLSDRRDDPVWPTKGSFITGDTEIALRGIGSEVGYTKTLVQLSKYGHLKGTKRVVAAGRLEVGLARGFARPNPDPTDPDRTITDIPISQRFFAGGATTVRGFTTDLLAAPNALTNEGLPLGGNGLLILNLEMREIVGNLFGRQLQTVQFVDIGNVYAKVSDFLHYAPRSSVGGGIRYLSPIGPIRLDVGVKTRPLVFQNGTSERRWEIHFSLGQAF